MPVLAAGLLTFILGACENPAGGGGESGEETKATVAAPTASPAAGAVEPGATVTLSTETEGAAIYYTTDGTTPTAESTLYSGPVSLSSLTLPVTIKAVAVKADWTDSDVLTVAYIAEVTEPALHYDFTGTGDTVPDLAGNYDGTLTAGAYRGTVGGYPYMYTGAGGYLDMGAAAGSILTGQTDFTIAVYVNITAEAALSGDGWFLWSFANRENVTGEGNCIWFRGTDTQFTISKTGWTGESWVRTGSPLPKGTWQHVMYRQRGSTGTIYINGEAAAAGTTAIASAELSELIYNYIGRPCYSSDNYMKYTKYADFRIYPGAILPATIAEIHITETVEALNAAEALRSGTPVAGITAAGKKTGGQNSVTFSLTSENDGTWRVYGTAAGGSVLTAETVSYDGNAKVLTLSSASSLAAGVYYVSVEESGKEESERLALTVKDPLIFGLSFDTETTQAETGVVTANGSLAGMTYEDGIKGKAGVFPGGADNYLSIAGTGGGNLLGGLGEFTVSFWVKTSSSNSWWFYAAPDTRNQTYQSEYYVGVLGTNGARMDCERFLNGRTNGTFNSGDNSVTPGTWTHVILVHRNDTAEIYLNGVSKGTLANARFIPDILGANPICYIGRANWTDNGEGAEGSIDEYKIHSYALDSAEASALYAADGGE
jgi:hypothetical protein